MKGLLFTYGLTYGGSVASLFNPFYGLLVYVCFATLRPEYLWYWSVPVGGNFSRTAAIALLVGWAIHGFGDWNFRLAKPIVFALLMYFGWQCLSALFADNQSVAWSQIERQGKIVLPFVVGLTLIRSVAQLKCLAWVIVLSMAFVAYQANMSYWAGYNWLRVDGFGGMDNNSNCIGMVAVGGLAFFMGIAERVWWRRWTAFAAAGFLAHAPLFGDSRGGMLGLIITGIVSFALLPKQPRHYAFFVLAVVCGLRLAGPDVIDRFSTVFTDAQARDASAQGRLDLWVDCWEVMKQHPILGVGPDHWPLIAHRFGWPPGKECHSLWFNAGAELGFPGLAALVAFYGIAAWLAWKLARREGDFHDPWFGDSGRMVIASLTGFAVAASFVSLDNLEPPYYIVLLGAGALKLASLEEKVGVNETEAENAVDAEPTVREPMLESVI